MYNLPVKPPPSGPSAERRKRDRNRRERRAEKHRPSEAGPSRPRSRERDPNHDRHGHTRDKKKFKAKEKERPILNSALNDLNTVETSKKPAVAKKTFEMGEDFVAFVDSSEDGDRAPVRDWDKGKGKARALDRERDRNASGKKRKYDFVFDDNDLVEHRRETIFRKAPWATAVDWESCKNVSEMFALILCQSVRRAYTFSFAGYTVK